MPEPQDPDGSQGNEGSVGNSTVQQMRKQIEKLEKDANDAKAEAATNAAAVAERDALKQEIAGFQKQALFDQLNIPSTGTGKLFRDTYQGDITPEAITAKAAEYALIQATTAPQPTIPGVNQEAFARQMASLSGTAPSTQPNAMEAINSAKSEGDLKTLLEGLGLMGS